MISPWTYPGLRATNNIVTVDMVLGSITELLMEHYGVKPTLVMTQSRNACAVWIRELICYYMKETFGDKVTLESLGQFYNGRDHTTIIHNIQSFRNRCKCNAPLPTQLRTDNSGTVAEYTFIKLLIQQKCLLEFQGILVLAKTR